MSRALTLATRQALTAQETDEVFLILLTIAAQGLTEPIRVVNDRANLTSRGVEHIAFPFEIALPGEDAETVAVVKLRIDNVDRSIVATLRQLVAPPTITIEVVRAKEPDVVEAGPFVMQMISASYDARTVDATLTFEDVLNSRFPADDFSPSSHPGLF